jgi:hypothetical protein
MSLEPPSPKNFIGSTDKTLIERRNRVISALFYGNVSDIIKKYFVALKEHIGNRDLKNDLIADLGSCGNEDMCMATLKDFIATHNLMVYVVANDAERQTLPNEQLLFGSRNFKNKFILAAALEQSYDTGGVEIERLEDCIVLFENNTEVLNDVISDINEIKKNNKINDIREHIVYLSTSSDDKIYLVGEPSIRTSKRRTRSPRRKSSSRPSSLRITRGGGSYKKRSYSKTRRNRVKK